LRAAHQFGISHNIARRRRPLPTSARRRTSGKILNVAVQTRRSIKRALQDAVEEAAARLNVPGVAVGVLDGSEEHHVYHGVTSIENPLPVDENTFFQIGSTGKTFTATAIMRLVEAGRVSLDATVRTYVPELKLRDEHVAKKVTVLQLLNHTAGWNGDFFEDQGDGDDALKRYVSRMRKLQQVFQPGSGTASYNNASLALAGRLIEKVTGKVYEKAMRELVFDPVGLENCLFFANDIMTRRFAAGHLNREEEGVKSLVVQRPWRMIRAANPMGGISATLPDTLKWARFHLGDGTGKDGRPVLSRASLDLMKKPTAKLPVALGDSVGISWLIRRFGDVTLVGHGGTTPGQLSAFQMVPERGFAVAINTNSTSGGQLHREILQWVLKEFLGVVEPEAVPLELPADQLLEYAGEYRSDTSIYTITVETDHLEMSGRPTKQVLQILKKMGQEPPKPQPPISLKILPGDLAVVLDGPGKGMKAEYQRLSGVITGINIGGRLAVKQP
jgi:CubicO group peptidase (beta-lactamase class C family)